MLLRSSAVVIRRVVIALLLSLSMGVTAIAQTTPAAAREPLKESGATTIFIV